MSTKRKKAYVLLSATLYLASLTQDAFFIGRADYDAWASSAWLVAVGWAGAFLGGGAALVWFANPLLFLSWVLSFFNLKLARWASACTTLLAASFLLFDEVITSEAPTYSTITHYRAGYWLWLASCVAYAACLWFPTENSMTGQSPTELN